MMSTGQSLKDVSRGTQGCGSRTFESFVTRAIAVHSLTAHQTCRNAHAPATWVSPQVAHADLQTYAHKHAFYTTSITRQ